MAGPCVFLCPMVLDLTSPDISSVVCCRVFFGRGGRFQQRSEILSKGAQKAPFPPLGHAVSRGAVVR